MSYIKEFTTRRISFDYGNFCIAIAVKATLFSKKDPKKLISGDMVEIDVNVNENPNVLEGNSRSRDYSCHVWFSGQGINRKINFTVFHNKLHYLTFYTDVDFAQKIG